MIYFGYAFGDGKVLKFKRRSANLSSASVTGCSSSSTFSPGKTDRITGLAIQ